MQSLGVFFEDNKPLAFVIMFAALLVIIIVLFLLYRVMFGRRLRTASGGRARQPRLGIVDAYDLDRQRQLVLVRRDNVEHLVMIGGPNDVLLESSIVRAHSQAAAPGARDKDVTPPSIPAMAAGPQAPTTQAPSAPKAPVGPAMPPPRQAPPVAAPNQGGAPPIASPFPPNVAPPPAPAVSGPQLVERPANRPAPAEDWAQSAGPARPAPVPPPARPVGVPPQRPGPGPVTPGTGTAPRPAALPNAPRPVPVPRPPSSLPPRPNLASNLPPRPSRPITPVPPRSDAPVPSPRDEAPTAGQTGSGAEPEARPARQPESAPPVIIGPPPPPRPADADEGNPTAPKSLETFESLEEEMAKLLGRPAGRRDGQPE